MERGGTLGTRENGPTLATREKGELTSAIRPTPYQMFIGVRSAMSGREGRGEGGVLGKRGGKVKGRREESGRMCAKELKKRKGKCLMWRRKKERERENEGRKGGSERVE